MARIPRASRETVWDDRLAFEPMSPVRFAQLDTALGPMLAAWTDAGIAALSRGLGLSSFQASVGRRFPGVALEPDAPPVGVGRQLDEFLSGRRRDFEFGVDLTGLAAFDARVYDAVRAIPYGETATYGEIAAGIGVPGAARAVGGAMSRCPLFPIVPCHRVVRAADGVSGWGGDPSVKRLLLRMESRARDRAPR
jgi:O-6-methylguanine DNA methyltransferase